MASESVAIPAEAIPAIRRALLMGMHAIAEVERCRSHFALLAQGIPVTSLACPVAVAASEGDTTAYVEAMLWLDSAESAALNAE